MLLNLLWTVSTAAGAGTLKWVDLDGRDFPITGFFVKIRQYENKQTPINSIRFPLVQLCLVKKVRGGVIIKEGVK